MGKLSASCLFLTVAAATAQTGQSSSQRPLPQWLTGLIAVSSFLFLAFVAFLMKKAWCGEASRKHGIQSVSDSESAETDENIYSTQLDMVRSSEDTHAYNNVGMDGGDDKITSM